MSTVGDIVHVFEGADRDVKGLAFATGETPGEARVKLETRAKYRDVEWQHVGTAFEYAEMVRDAEVMDETFRTIQ